MATTLDDLFKQFLRERKYLRNVSAQTIEWYETAWKTFRNSATSCLSDPAGLKRSHLEQFVYALRDRRVRPVSCNTWLRALNAFFRWLHENGHIESPIYVRRHAPRDRSSFGPLPPYPKPNRTPRAFSRDRRTASPNQTGARIAPNLADDPRGAASISASGFVTTRSSRA